jgi:hypothetical protein
MSPRVSPRLRPWPSVSPTVRVSGFYPNVMLIFPLTSVDANAFKDAFETAQIENEKLFNAEE